MNNPHLISSILFTIIIISFYIPTCCSQQYKYNCSDTYNCGQNIKELGYPFSGRDRHSVCGLAGFELTCWEQDNTTTIVINSQTYRVLEINSGDRTITLADYQENVCPLQSAVAALNDTLFGYSLNDVRFLEISYSCPDFSSIIPDRNIIRCSGDGNKYTSGFYLNESFPEKDRRLCRIHVGVPVNRTILREFEESDSSLSLRELIGEGVRVDYKYDVEACSKCEETGRVCWSGTNKSLNSSCLCHDGEIRGGDCSAGKGLNTKLKVTLGIGAGVFGILATSLGFFLYHRRKINGYKGIEAFITQYGFSTPKLYRFYEIKRMTNSFKDELGRGGFGTVFKGMLQDGSLVAVKVLKKSKENGEEFINEVASIGKTSHVNIVSLLGFCYEGKKRALVYEFMRNGSLEKFLNYNIPKESARFLGVEKLHEIAVGIARGLEYLHRGCTTRILHFDIKPHNILLDENLCPKISDFGLAKIHSREESIVSMNEEARGTIGYIAPEVFNRNFGGVSHKSDVYSYGMMLLEMVCGRKNINARDNHSSEIYFPQWIYKQLELDDYLGTPIMENEIARKMKIVGLWCIQTNPSERPSIKKVIEMLEGTIEGLQIPPNTFYSSPPLFQVTSSATPESTSVE